MIRDLFWNFSRQIRHSKAFLANILDMHKEGRSWRM